MDVPLYPALIGGACTLSAPIVALMVKSWLGRRSFRPLAPSRRQAIQGVWRGNTVQEKGPTGEAAEVDLLLTLRAFRNVVKGHARVRWKSVEERVALEGGFRSDSFLLLTYNSTSAITLNFGTLLLRLSANGDRLHGRMLGFGSESETIVHGCTELQRDYDPAMNLTLPHGGR
jgi:hypothetical protein